MGGLSPLLFVLGAAIIWSTGGLFIKLTTLSPYELTFWRSLFAAFTVALFTRREGFGLNRMTALTSLLYAALLLLFVIANKRTTAANAIFLQYTAPIYMLVFEPLLYKEKFRSRDLVVVVVCIAGMSLFFVGQLKPSDIEGNLAALGSGICMALYFLFLRHARSREVNRASSVIYGNLLLIVAMAIVAPAMSPDGLRVLFPSFKNFLLVAYLGVIQIGFGYTLFTLGMARGVRSLQAGIVGYVEPVLNPIWVFLFYGEQPTRWAILGGAIIITAVIAHTLLGARKALATKM
ncbi:MAG: hypothetical protein AUG51_13500 [Acidobacteria bacterium 13_1_20CM_3_53_8]|nr:MAG: hypothetical protein AUG51_13500 [Acidobacteria bacterium 13_1_20CM_3_53_8]